MTEDAPTDPRSTYAATKLAPEHSAPARAPGRPVGSVWALRHRNAYGARMPPGYRRTGSSAAPADLPALRTEPAAVNVCRRTVRRPHTKVLP